MTQGLGPDNISPLRRGQVSRGHPVSCSSGDVESQVTGCPQRPTSPSGV